MMINKDKKYSLELNRHFAQSVSSLSLPDYV